MTNEIKNIIAEMQLRNGRYIMCKNEDISFSDEDYKTHILLDYITNLQKENEILNQNNQAMQEEMARTWKIADDYKSRIDKAIEEIETIKQHYEELRKSPFEDSVFLTDMLRQSFILSVESYLELILAILGDKE